MKLYNIAQANMSFTFKGLVFYNWSCGGVDKSSTLLSESRMFESYSEQDFFIFIILANFSFFPARTTNT